MKTCIPKLLVPSILLSLALSASEGGDCGKQAHKDRSAGKGLSFDSGDYLTGSWGGYREKLVERGIDIELSYTAEPEWNPVGGERQSATYLHNIGISGLFDLEKLAGIPGTTFLIQGSQRSGKSLTEEAIGNAISVQQLFGGGQTYRLVEMRVTNELFEDQLELAYGRLSATSDFMTSPFYCDFVTNGICGQPTAPFFNMSNGISAYPVAVWGAMAKAKPTSESYLMAGIYDGDAAGADRGTDFRFGDDGVLLISEIGLRPEAGFLSLPGRYSMGAYYHTGDFSDVATDVNGGNLFITGAPPRQDSNQSGVYCVLEQMVHRHGDHPSQGLNVFATFVVSPDLEKSEMPFFLNGGLVYDGLFAARPHDHTALGFYTTWFSSDLRDAQRAAGLEGQTAETGIELNHQFQFTPYFYLRPDVQYIVRPNGLSSIDNALVVGCEVGLTF